MANLTKNTFAGGNVVEVLVAAAAGGDTVLNFDSKDFLVVNNSHATLPRTITLVNQETDSHGHDTDVGIVVVALARSIIEPSQLPGGATRFKESVTGSLQITYSDAAANITIGAFRRP